MADQESAFDSDDSRDRGRFLGCHAGQPGMTASPNAGMKSRGTRAAREVVELYNFTSIGVFHLADGRITEVYDCGHRQGFWK